MHTFSKIMTIVTLLAACAEAKAGCIERMQDYIGDPALTDFIQRLGSVERIAGTWEGSGHKIEIHVLDDRIKSRVDDSNLADIRICSSAHTGEIVIQTLRPDGSVSATSKIHLHGDGSIGVQGNGTFGLFVGFHRTEPYEVPATVLASVRSPGVQTAALIERSSPALR